MKRIDIESKKIIDHKSYRKKNAKESDADVLVECDTEIWENGEKRVLYKEIGDEADELIEQIRMGLLRLKFATTRRVSGLLGEVINIGYIPRNPVKRQDYCRLSAGLDNNLGLHEKLFRLGEILCGEYYQKHFEKEYDYHKEQMEEVIEEWRMGDSLYTSGIINRNNQLPYHTDRGNFEGVMSTMLVLKNKTQGGHLVLPEMNARLNCKDKSLVIFDGQKILHGMTDIKYRGEGAYRFSYEKMLDTWGRIRKIKKKKCLK